MAARSCVRLVASFSVVALASVNGRLVFASGEPQDSFLYQNFVRASEILDRAVAAHGGVEMLDRATNIRFSFTGTFHYEAHFTRPWAYKDYSLAGATLYSTNLQAVKSEATLTLSDETNPSFAIIGPTNGLVLDAGEDRPDSVAAKELEKSLRQELELLPHEYLRQARAGAAGLRLLSGNEDYEVLCYSLDDGEGRALFFDPKTHLLMRVERIGHWKHKGDRLEWRTFADYANRNGIQVPLHSESHIEGGSTQQNVISEIAKIEFGGVVNAEEFAIPAAYRAGFEGWTLQQPAAASSDGLLPSHDLGNGAYIIELPSSTSRSLLVAFSDYSVIVEAGDHSEIAAKLLATADHLLPDKPVRYVAMSHHHPLYANGLRPYAQRGITILATAGNVAYYRDLTTRPYRIHPDEQQRHPRAPKIEVIDGTHTIEDGKQRLEFYQFDYSTHVDEFVLAYLPSHKLIVTGDLVYVLRGKELGPARPRELAIHRVVDERKLDVQKIMQTWFVSESDHTVPYSVLQEKVRLAQAKEPKK